MDAGPTSLDSKSKSTRGVNVRSLLPLFTGVLAILAGARMFFDVPKPLLVVAAIVFGFCALLFWTTRSRCTGLAAARVLHLVVAWIVVTVLLFGTVFWVDRAGWIWFRLTGYNVTLSEDHWNAVDLSMSDFVRLNPEFEIVSTEKNRLALRGDHLIDRTVVIPRGVELVIEPGTVLRFGPACSMICYGPVRARGTQRNPIQFTARHALLKWGVIGVVGSEGGKRSLFEYTSFDHGRQARVNRIDFRGCLSIIGGGADIRHNSFSHLFGKDAVYVLKADILIHDNVVQNTFKDGLDLDGSRGEIHHNRFVDCGDEGIDLSHSEDVHVYSNVILDERGGRLGADQNLAEIRASNTLGHSNADGNSDVEDAGYGVRQ
jgi:hypothetical protein